MQALHINLTFKYFTKVEGKHAIDSPGMPKSAEVPPEEYLLEENEERSMIEPKSYDNPKLKSLIRWARLRGDFMTLASVDPDD